MSDDLPRVVEQLNSALHQLMEMDDRVLVIGEDLRDPYGGAFKVTRGLSTRFPERVLSTPISEAGFIGLATGLAMRGMRPVAELMFGDFITLAADQIINHASKFRWVYNDKVRVPLVIRAPMGGRRGYGPTHSQSLEKLVMGIPGLQVVAPSLYDDWGNALKTLIGCNEDPLVFVENKVLYPKRMKRVEAGRSGSFVVSKAGDGALASTILTLGDAAADVTLACYGGMTEYCEAAALKLFSEHEVLTEIVVVPWLAPLAFDSVRASVERTGRAVVVEEGTRPVGWGAEVASRLAEECYTDLRAPVARVAARNLPIGNSKVIEDWILPDACDIIDACMEVVRYKRPRTRIVGSAKEGMR